MPDLKAYKMADAFQEICKVTKKWGLYISCSNEVDSAEIMKAAPYLNFDQSIDLMFDGMFFLFDTEAEMNKHYKLTVGDNGATKLNKYDGNARIYALTCSNKGELWNENT